MILLHFSFFSRNLANNSLGTIEGSIFGGASVVGRDLLLQSNSLTGLSYDAFDHVIVTNIFLNDNLLTVYPQALLLQNPEIM